MYPCGSADTEQCTQFAVNGTVTSLPVFIQNILNCVPKMDEAFTGFLRKDSQNLTIMVQSISLNQGL